MRCALGVVVHSLPFAAGSHFCGKVVVWYAQQIRRARGARGRRLELEENTHKRTNYCGVARNEMTTDEFRDMINKEIGDFATTKLDPQQWDWLSKRIYYISGDFGDPVVYQNLSNLLTTLDKEHGTRGNYFFYLATSPSFFSPVIKQLGAAKLVAEENGWRRVVIEKPFGRDYDSAKK